MAANLNVDGDRLLIDKDSATIGVKEDTTQAKLVTPPGVPGLCVTEKVAAPNDLITEVSLPLSGDNSASKACDGGVAVTQDSPQATTAPNLDPESNGKSREKRERESDNTSGIRVKRRLRLSEDTEQESVHDYDARGAELWIDGEIAACEAYEFSQGSNAATLLNMIREVTELTNGVRRNNNSSAQPVPQRTARPQTVLTNCFTELLKAFHKNEVLRTRGFIELTNLIRGMHRESRVLSNEMYNTRREINKIRVDQRQMLDAITLLLERLNVIEMYVKGLHQTLMK